ncbi:MAG: Uma2 family endonuclease [Pirellula sp.]
MTTNTPLSLASTVVENQELPLDIAPSVDHLVTEDDTPVDNMFSEKQQRLLTEPLYSSWQSPVPFLALANVGLFHAVRLPPYVPDMLLSLNAQAPANLFPKSNRSYFLWEYGKPPDIVVEIVSNKTGNEDPGKLAGYASIGIHYYIIYDPEQWLGAEPFRFYELRGSDYFLLTGAIHFMPKIGLGVTLWNGSFERHQDQWLRWTDLSGKLIATGSERAIEERQRADEERQRADEERQRADEERQRADEERQLANKERQRADEAHQRAEKLAEQLKRLGVSQIE